MLPEGFSCGVTLHNGAAEMFEVHRYSVSGVVPGMFLRGADFFHMGAKIWFSGYY